MKSWNSDKLLAGVLLSMAALLVIGFVVNAAWPQQQHYAGTATLMKVPLSGAAWVPPDQPQPAPANIEQRLQQLEAKIDRILKLFEEAAGPDPAGAAVGPPPQALLEALGTCVTCHADRVAKTKGDGFTLFLTRKDDDGKEQSIFRDDFSLPELRRIRREVEDGLMPKKTSGKTLTAEQKAAVLSEVKTMIARRESEPK